jgi:hypothetical protein
MYNSESMPQHKHNHNQLSLPIPETAPVAPRFSFADPGLQRRDQLTPDGLVRRRVVSYPTPTDEALTLRTALIAAGLVLGDKLDDRADGQDRFLIPSSSRPISYEAASDSSNELAYNDASLFYDLGSMLARVAMATEDSPVFLAGVGRNVALIEFTKINEPKILLVPGFEAAVTPMPAEDDVLSSYESLLGTEFGPRFNSHAPVFTEGFRSVIG